MTVTATNRKNEFTTNGVTVDFPFTFAITDIAQVFAVTVVGDTETPYDDFSVVENTESEGGTLTTGTALSGVELIVYRDTPFTQNTNYEDGGQFPADSHEEALDKLTLQNQDQQEEISRSIKTKISVGNGYEVGDLENGKLLGLEDDVIVSIATDTDEFNTLLTVAISLNVELSKVIYSTDTTTTLDDVSYIYDAANEVIFSVPNTIGTGELLVSLDGSELTTTNYTRSLVRAGVKSHKALSTGQSNMVGSSNVLEGDQSTNDLVYAWNARFTDVGDGYQLAELGEIPFNGGGQQHIGFNAAKHIASTRGEPVSLINMAQGGTAIDKWLSDSADPEMWDAIEANCSASYALDGEKVGIVFWHQGEANVSSDLFYYIDSFLQFRQQVMDAEWSSDDVKFIIGGLALGSPLTGTSGANPSMNLAFSMLAEREANITTVYTGDLISDSTGVHFTDNSIIEIGKRMGEAAFSSKQEVAQPTRYVESSTNLTYQEGEGYFRDFEDMINFLSCLEFKGGARLNVTLPAGVYEINPTRFNFDGALINFSGELDAGFTQPVKADFTGVEADDLVMLQGKYLTQLNITGGNSFFVLNGSNSGVWTNMLLTHASPTLGATFIRNSDPSLYNIGGGAIEFDNVAMHGANGNSCIAVRADEGCYIKVVNGTISHCDQGVTANDARAFVKENVIAYTPTAINAANRAFINAYGLQIESPTGISYTSSIGSYVDARTADDNTNSSTASNGIVQT